MEDMDQLFYVKYIVVKGKMNFIYGIFYNYLEFQFKG